MVFEFEHQQELDENMVFQLNRIIEVKKNLSVIDPINFIKILETLGENSDIDFPLTLNICFYQIILIFQNFLSQERSIIPKITSPEDFYIVFANSNILLHDSNLNRETKTKLGRIANEFKNIYFGELKRSNSKFSQGEGIHIKKYILEEISELEKKTGNNN